ncbi:hypothetical protein ACCO45_013590 [Purpureocillium lilacinum]|uniref:Uncharacterized protein n=1 Tax=Purpureocillium lilacinum TaxID=33203 RepID=A0ACC4D7D3_PURLI
MDRPINFVFPVKHLEDDGIRLVPFDAKAHGHRFHASIARSGGAAFAHFSSGPYASADDFIEQFVLTRSYADKRMFTFAILVAPKHRSDGADLAGMVSLTNADAENRRADIGLLHVLPEAQGRGIGTRACRLLLRHGMDSPNDASIRLAQKLALREVGVVRYERLLSDGVARNKAGNGRPPPPGTADGDLWRDVVVYEMTWDEWHHTQKD